MAHVDSHKHMPERSNIEALHTGMWRTTRSVEEPTVPTASSWRQREEPIRELYCEATREMIRRENSEAAVSGDIPILPEDDLRETLEK